MNKNFFAGLLVGLGLLAIFAFRPVVEKPATPVQKWEYNRANVGLMSESKMTEMGRQGWDLVALESGVGYFKRPSE